MSQGPEFDHLYWPLGGAIKLAGWRTPRVCMLSARVFNRLRSCTTWKVWVVKLRLSPRTQSHPTLDVILTQDGEVWSVDFWTSKAETKYVFAAVCNYYSLTVVPLTHATIYRVWKHPRPRDSVPFILLGWNYTNGNCIGIEHTAKSEVCASLWFCSTWTSSF